METTSIFVYSRPFPLKNNPTLSLRHFNKHPAYQTPIPKSHNQTIKSITHNPKSSLSSGINSNPENPLVKTQKDQFFSHPCSSISRTHLLYPLKCSYSEATKSETQNPVLKTLKKLSFDSVKTTLFQLTPIEICKWAAVLCIPIAATKWAVNGVLNPFFWMYFSWTWLFWPWFIALSITAYGIYCLRKHSRGEANEFEQISILTSTLTWLTLVPPAYFNGYLEGWPFVLFFVYHYFTFFNISVRKRLYGDHYLRPHDPKWDINTPKWCRLLFCIAIFMGHWLAAFEGPELHLIPGGWNNLWVWGLITLSLFMQYYSTLYLANYSEKVVVPTAVVQFGPYRLVRHPIYASTLLLFVTYCLAMRAPISALFTAVVCVMYYEQKTKLEEALMVETFGEKYRDYSSRVRYKFIPFVY